MMPSLGFRFSILRTGVLAVALLACHSMSAAAQVRVDGSADAVRIDVSNAPLRDVLGALQARFGLRYRSNDALDGTRTLTLQAPLRRVVARLLEGYDFVIAVRPGGIDVMILQQSAAANVATSGIPSAPAPPPVTPVAPAAQASYRERD
jgi:hypothetical protein